ncbi:ATP-binding protein [Enterocloster asparagiformis]|uniref:ATP-binding protein n=1 Tax=Enterocloster asparagiformis TaxID=333367 RepID=UPI002A81C646|nr:ATP-binding protein [Enterocloster asparagiformis]
MIKRDNYMNIIRGFIDKPLIKVITGVRRCGKSMLLQLIREELIERGVSGENIVYLNFESLKNAYIQNYLDLYHVIEERVHTVSGKVYILLDELQDITEWEKAVNSFLVDFDCDVYVTGSNAKLLAGEFATYIAGRYVEIKLYPLTFREFLSFAQANSTEDHLALEQQFQNYLRFGGMPGIHMMRWDDILIDQYLTDIYNSVMLKDVVQRNDLRRPAQLEKIMLFIMDNIGNTFSAKTIIDFVKSQGRTISNESMYGFLRALQEAFIIHKVPRYDIKGKRLLETQEKYYVADLGIRHAVMGYRDHDIAGLLENVVYMELLTRGYTVNIGKQGATEVDFVAQKKDERIYIQVSYLLADDKVVQREFAPLEAIQDNYTKMVLTMDPTPEFNREGIYRKSIINFLLEDQVN